MVRHAYRCLGTRTLLAHLHLGMALGLSLLLQDLCQHLKTDGRLVSELHLPWVALTKRFSLAKGFPTSADVQLKRSVIILERQWCKSVLSAQRAQLELIYRGVPRALALETRAALKLESVSLTTFRDHLIELCFYSSQ